MISTTCLDYLLGVGVARERGEGGLGIWDPGTFKAVYKELMRFTAFAQSVSRSFQRVGHFQQRSGRGHGCMYI